MHDEQSTRPTGPMMLCATKVLKRPPIRISSLGPNLKLPRSVELRQAVPVVLLGLAFAIPGVVLLGIQGFVFGGALGGGLGWLLSNWSPSRGETTSQWVSVQLKSHLRGSGVAKVDGAKMYIGIAPLRRDELGEVQLTSSAVNVNPDDYDEHGVLRSESNGNLLEAPRIIRDRSVGRPAPTPVRHNAPHRGDHLGVTELPDTPPSVPHRTAAPPTHPSAPETPAITPDTPRAEPRLPQLGAPLVTPAEPDMSAVPPAAVPGVPPGDGPVRMVRPD